MTICLTTVPKKSLTLVSLDDPAFDKDRFTPQLVALYEETQDWSGLPLRAGREEQVMVAHCRPLDVDAADQAMRTGLARGKGVMTEVLLSYFERGTESVECHYRKREDAPAKRGKIKPAHFAALPLEWRIDIGRQIRELSHNEPDEDSESDPGK